MSEANALEVLEKFKNYECPVCGENSWSGVGALGNLLVALPVKTPGGEIVAAAGEWASVDAFAYACGTCGYLRLHVVEKVAALAAELPDQTS